MNKLSLPMFENFAYGVWLMGEVMLYFWSWSLCSGNVGL